MGRERKRGKEENEIAGKQSPRLRKTEDLCVCSLNVVGWDTYMTSTMKGVGESYKHTQLRKLSDLAYMRVNKLEMFGDVVYKNDPLGLCCRGHLCHLSKEMGVW